MYFCTIKTQKWKLYMKTKKALPYHQEKQNRKNKIIRERRESVLGKNHSGNKKNLYLHLKTF